jgi:hypothetical protein
MVHPHLRPPYSDGAVRPPQLLDSGGREAVSRCTTNDLGPLLYLDADQLTALASASHIRSD